MTDDQHRILVNAITEAVSILGRKLDQQNAILADIRDVRVPRRSEQTGRPANGGHVNLERLTASGVVVSCTRPMKDGEYSKTSKGSPIWNLTLEGATPFKIRLFDDKPATFALDAQRLGRTVIIEYEKSLDGKYDNFRTIKVASEAPAAKAQKATDPF